MVRYNNVARFLWNFSTGRLRLQRYKILENVCMSAEPKIDHSSEDLPLTGAFVFITGYEIPEIPQ